MRFSVWARIAIFGAWPLLGHAVEPADAAPNPAPLYQETTPPQFPHQLERGGVTKGEADVAVEIDATGQLRDALVVAYTLKAFADDAIETIRAWIFYPDRHSGHPQAWSHLFRIKYQLEGANLVIYSPADHLPLGNHSYGADENDTLTYDVCRPRELDGIPRPLKIVAPAATRDGSVDVAFYIDETGRVRIPVVRSGSDRGLEAAALAAVRRWRFDPPLRSGHPVLVRVDQVFDFHPPPPATP